MRRRPLVCDRCLPHLPGDGSSEVHAQLAPRSRLELFTFQDTFGQGFFLPKQYTALYLIVPALVLTLIIRPHRAGNYCDFLWTFAMYLEGVAIYPQLHMFQKNRVGFERAMDGRQARLSPSRRTLCSRWLPVSS